MAGFAEFSFAAELQSAGICLKDMSLRDAAAICVKAGVRKLGDLAGMNTGSGAFNGMTVRDKDALQVIPR